MFSSFVTKIIDVKYGANPLYIHDKLYAVGDVHGENEKLKDLLGKIRALLQPSDHLVFCGDLVDRGPDSPGVLKTIRDFKVEHPNTFVVRGNHEEMMCAYAGLGRCNYSWIHNGGRDTLEQFLVDWSHREGKSDFREVLEKQNLLGFIQSFIPYYESEQVIVTHAPFDRNIVAMSGGLDKEPVENLLEAMGDAIRWKFTDEDTRIPEIEKFRICGHQFNQHKKPRIFKECAFIDTGCGYKPESPLAAIQFPGKKTIYGTLPPP